MYIEKYSEFSETVSSIQPESQPVPPMLVSVCESVESEADPLFKNFSLVNIFSWLCHW